MDDQSDIYEVIDEEYNKLRDETFSGIKTPPIAYPTNTQDNVEGFALSQCRAYVPVNLPSAARGEKDVEDEENGVYETIDPIYTNLSM